MKNFQLLARNLNTLPLMHAIQRKPHLWDQNKLRTTYPNTVHGDVSDIWLRFNAIEGSAAAVMDDCECINYPALAELPQARPLIFGLMSMVEGERLGRCLITKLPPEGIITPHCDQGAPATYYKRYHIILQALPGVKFHCGGETVEMQSGECWWMDNSKEHSVVNNSPDDRVHLIIDIRGGVNG